MHSVCYERFSNTQITKMLITKQLYQLVFKMILWYFLAYMAKKQYLCSEIQNSHDYENKSFIYAIMRIISHFSYGSQRESLFS